MNDPMHWVRLCFSKNYWLLLFGDDCNPEKFLVDYYAAVANKIRQERNQQFMIFKFFPHGEMLTAQNVFVSVKQYIFQKFGFIFIFYFLLFSFNSIQQNTPQNELLFFSFSKGDYTATLLKLYGNILNQAK